MQSRGISRLKRILPRPGFVNCYFVRYLLLLLPRLEALAPHLLNQPRRLHHTFKADSRSLLVILNVTRKVFGRGIVDTKSAAQEIADRLRLEFAKLTR